MKWKKKKDMIQASIIYEIRLAQAYAVQWPKRFLDVSSQFLYLSVQNILD